MKRVLIFTVFSLSYLALTGCDNSKAAAPIKIDSNFSLISDKCQLIGAINIEDIANIEGVQKLVKQEDKAIPYYREISAAGLGIDNLKALYFGAEIPTHTNQTNFNSEGVFLLQAKSKINLANFVSLIEKNSEVKFSKESIDSKQAYVISASNAATPSTYIIPLSDTLVAIGTKVEATNTVKLSKKVGKSVLDNSVLMKLTNKWNKKDLVWFAASVPPEFNKNNAANSPDINELFISANYLNENITIIGDIVCATAEDVQKILMPAQVITSMAVMSSNNTIKAEDLSLKAEKNNLVINVKLSKTALKYIMEKGAQQMQPSTAESTYEETNPTASTPASTVKTTLTQKTETEPSGPKETSTAAASYPSKLHTVPSKVE